MICCAFLSLALNPINHSSVNHRQSYHLILSLTMGKTLYIFVTGKLKEEETLFVSQGKRVSNKLQALSSDHNGPFLSGIDLWMVMWDERLVCGCKLSTGMLQSFKLLLTAIQSVSDSVRLPFKICKLFQTVMVDFGGHAISTRTIGDLDNAELEYKILTNLTHICEAVKWASFIIDNIAFSFVDSSSHDPPSSGAMCLRES